MQPRPRCKITSFSQQQLYYTRISQSFGFSTSSSSFTSHIIPPSCHVIQPSFSFLSRISTIFIKPVTYFNPTQTCTETCRSIPIPTYPQLTLDISNILAPITSFSNRYLHPTSNTTFTPNRTTSLLRHAFPYPQGSHSLLYITSLLIAYITSPNPLPYITTHIHLSTRLHPQSPSSYHTEHTLAHFWGPIPLNTSHLIYLLPHIITSTLRHYHYLTTRSRGTHSSYTCIQGPKLKNGLFPILSEYYFPLRHPHYVTTPPLLIYT